jgi:hypothetical protein
MGAPPRAEAIAVLGERSVPTLLENLQQRLLDEAVAANVPPICIDLVARNAA